MPIILATILIILFLIKLLRDSLFFTWLWQVKEYRVDRMKLYLGENKNIISIIFENNFIYIFAIILFILYFIFLKNYPLIFQYFVLAFFIFSVFEIMKEIKKKSLKRPKPTFKMLLIFFIEIAFYSLFLTIFWDSIPAGLTSYLVLFLLFFYLVVPILITIIILIINPFFNFQKRRIIKKATFKMQGLKKIKVIGITGSYGKTSTKEFLYDILSQKYKVVKTEGNNNTNIGVAYTILKNVSDEFDYFICEMGAYKIGEIREMCDIVKPNIGVLTGINEQHIGLFGSIENTKKAKIELIESLPENGLAIINGKLKMKSEKYKFKVKNINYFSSNSINDIKVCQYYVEFEYKNKKFKINIFGKHYIENVISAIMVSEYLGMSLNEIENALEKTESNRFMIRKLYGPNNSIFIDDSYSANPDGVIAALNYLNEAYTDYKKIIVFPGIIELGNKSDYIHNKLFSKIAEICDIAYILNQGIVWNRNSKKSQDFEEKTKPVNECEFIFENDFDKVAKMLKNKLDKKTAVLFESRGAGVVMGKLKK